MRRFPVFFPLTLALAVAAFCATLFAHAGPPAPVYQIVVHANNPTRTVDRGFLEDAFLKRVTSWPSGEAIRPADLASSSSVRRKFTDDVLRRSVEAVKSYWQQRIFSGRDVPPPELDGDDDIVRYVLKHEGAVGYVSGGANLNGSKVLSVR
jgi:ABC-type phosphate transport system substrate-binding protein